MNSVWDFADEMDKLLADMEAGALYPASAEMTELAGRVLEAIHGPPEPPEVWVAKLLFSMGPRAFDLDV